MRTLVSTAAILAALASGATAQTSTPAANPAPRPAPLPIPPAAQQVAAAVLALPEVMRAGARVWGYRQDGTFAELRAGTGTMTCIADNPNDNRFHVACYHNSMEPYMARGRELRTQGVRMQSLDSVRTLDVQAGRFRMPTSASLYSLTGPAGAYDPATNTTTGANPLYVIYLPFATAESVGLPTRPVRAGQPWMMHAGEVGAHIMLSPNM
jgi:hypothetical protein